MHPAITIVLRQPVKTIWQRSVIAKNIFLLVSIISCSLNDTKVNPCKPIAASLQCKMTVVIFVSCYPIQRYLGSFTFRVKHSQQHRQRRAGTWAGGKDLCWCYIYKVLNDECTKRRATICIQDVKPTIICKRGVTLNSYQACFTQVPQPVEICDRPNPIGIHFVKVLAVGDNGLLKVSALEVLDQTPLIDIKPVWNRTTEV